MAPRRVQFGPQDAAGQQYASSLLLRNSLSGHYYVDAFDTPVFLVGDSPWCCFTGLPIDKWIWYLKNRRAKGVNLINAMLIDRKFAVNAPNNWYGEAPFTGGVANFASPNPAYFARAQQYMHVAKQEGVVVQFFPFYFGFNVSDEGWLAEGLTAGPSVVQTYCAYVAGLFKDFDNLIWNIGGDWKPTNTAQYDIANACAAGIASQDARHLVTANGNRNAPAGSSARDWSVSWVTTNTTYTGSVTQDKSLTDYQQSPAMPSELIEAVYEVTTTGQVCRQQLYASVLSGMAGSTYGCEGVWQFASGWEALLDLPGARSLEWFGKLFRSFAWWKLVPDASSQLIQSGSRGTPGTIQYKTAAFTPDGKTGLVYFSDGGSGTCNIAGVMTTPCAASWLNPLTGAETAIGSFSGATQAFTAPAAHADGTDYVLILRGA